MEHSTDLPTKTPTSSYNHEKKNTSQYVKMQATPTIIPFFAPIIFCSNFKSNFSKKGPEIISFPCVFVFFSSAFLPFFSKACNSGLNNICFHSKIFGGIRIFGPGSWRMGVHVGGTCPLISFSQHLPLTSQYPIWGWPGLRQSRGGVCWGWPMRERQWGVLKVVGVSVEGPVESKLRGLTGWLLLWNVPLTAKTRPPTAACYRQVHGWCERGRWVGG